MIAIYDAATLPQGSPRWHELRRVTAWAIHNFQETSCQKFKP